VLDVLHLEAGADPVEEVGVLVAGFSGGGLAAWVFGGACALASRPWRGAGGRLEYSVSEGVVAQPARASPSTTMASEVAPRSCITSPV
jgi:hypothetical protein